MNDGAYMDLPESSFVDTVEGSTTLLGECVDDSDGGSVSVLSAVGGACTAVANVGCAVVGGCRGDVKVGCLPLITVPHNGVDSRGTEVLRHFGNQKAMCEHMDAS